MTARECQRLLYCAVAVLLAMGSGLVAAQPRELPARISTLGGRAEVSLQSKPWATATLREELWPGDSIRTVGGRLSVLTASGQSLRLGARTQVAFVSDDAVNGPTRVRMDGGLLWVSVFPNGPPSTHLELRVGPATITARGGGASIGTNPDGSVVVSVYHGTVGVAGEGWLRVLTQDQQLVVPPTGAFKELGAVKRDRRDAEWVKWNEQQDRAGGYGARIEK